MLSSMEARIAFGSKSSAQNSSCLFAQERLNFAASGKAGGEVCVRDLWIRSGFCEAVSVALGEFKF